MAAEQPAVGVIAALRRSIAILGERQEPAAATVAAGLHRLLSGDGETFETAFGLDPRWRQMVRIAGRDTALRDIALQHYAGLSDRQLASAITGDFGRYESAGFPRDRAARRRPDYDPDLPPAGAARGYRDD